MVLCPFAIRFVSSLTASHKSTFRDTKPGTHVHTIFASCPAGAEARGLAAPPCGSGIPPFGPNPGQGGKSGRGNRPDPVGEIIFLLTLTPATDILRPLEGSMSGEHVPSEEREVKGRRAAGVSHTGESNQREVSYRVPLRSTCVASPPHPDNQSS